MKEHAEEILNVSGLENSSPSWTRSTLVNDQAIKWAKAKACVHADSVLSVGRMEQCQEQQKGDGKAKLKISRCIHHLKMLWESMEKQLNSSGIFSRDFRQCLFFKRSRKSWRRTSNQRTSRTGSSSCQCSMTFCGKLMMRIASRSLRKGRVTRRNSYQDIGLFWVQGRKREGMATLTIIKDGSQVPVLWVVGSWSRKEAEVPFIHFNGDTVNTVNTELLFQTVHSVSQISVFAAVTDWCYQFGLINEEQVAIPVDTGISTMVEPNEVEMLVSPPNLALGNKMQGGASFRILGKRVQMTQFCKTKSLIPASCDSRKLLHNSTRRRIFTPLCREYSNSRVYPQNSSFGSYSRRYNYWTSHWSSRCENSWRTWNRSCDSINL